MSYVPEGVVPFSLRAEPAGVSGDALGADAAWSGDGTGAVAWCHGSGAVLPEHDRAKAIPPATAASARTSFTTDHLFPGYEWA